MEEVAETVNEAGEKNGKKVRLTANMTSNPTTDITPPRVVLFLFLVSSSFQPARHKALASVVDAAVVMDGGVPAQSAPCLLVLQVGCTIRTRL